MGMDSNCPSGSHYALVNIKQEQGQYPFIDVNEFRRIRW